MDADGVPGGAVDLAGPLRGFRRVRRATLLFAGGRATRRSGIVSPITREVESGRPRALREDVQEQDDREHERGRRVDVEDRPGHFSP